MDAQSKQPVKFLILSDTHELELGDERFPPRKDRFPSIDVVLHCGDFTDNGSFDALHKGMYMLSMFEAELRLLIAGNHEVSLDKEFYLTQGGTVDEQETAKGLMAADIAKAYGITFLDEGIHTFRLSNRAQFSIYVSPYTLEYGVSAFQYPSREDRFNPSTTLDWAISTTTSKSVIPEGVDIVMTHGPPRYILDRTSDGSNGGCEHLLWAINRVKPKLHCFGHIHAGYGVQRVAWSKSRYRMGDYSMIGYGEVIQDFVGKNQSRKKGYAELSPNAMADFRKSSTQTLFINAAIMDVKGQPSNAPWIVELDLPVPQSA